MKRKNGQVACVRARARALPGWQVHVASCVEGLRSRLTEGSSSRVGRLSGGLPRWRGFRIPAALKPDMIMPVRIASAGIFGWERKRRRQTSGALNQTVNWGTVNVRLVSFSVLALPTPRSYMLDIG
jgi:hypothetical protein